MAVSRLTDEQKAILSSYPQVAHLTECTVAFTQTFRHYFCEEYVRGKSPREILKDAGIDPEVLGAKRMYSLRWHALKEWEETSGETRPLRKQPSFVTAKTADDKLSKMEHELIYARQELNYLKKIYAADCKARKNWEREQRLAKNSPSFEKQSVRAVIS